MTVTVTGFEQCIAGWSATLDPGGATTGPQPGGTDDERTATLVIPDDLGAGTARVTASCDRGAGPEAVLDTTFTVEGPPETTTTTTDPGASTTTTPSTTTTTTGPSTTATTEAPPGSTAPGGGQGAPAGDG